MSNKIHYAPSGEWGQTSVNCGRYFTTDVRHTRLKEYVTCKYCLKALKKSARYSGLNLDTVWLNRFLLRI